MKIKKQVKHREKIKKYRQTLEAKAKRKKYNQRPEIRARMKKYRQKPEVKAKAKEHRQKSISKEKLKKYYQKPEVKARRKAYRRSPEIKAQEQEYRQRPEVKARAKEYSQKYLQKPEVKIRMKELGKKRRKSKKMGKNNKCIVCGEPSLDSYCSEKCKEIVIKEGGYFVWIEKNKYPIEWTAELKQTVRDRDNNCCMRCGKAKGDFKCALSIHHIDADKKNCNLNNLISLCDHINGSCHGLTRGKEQLFKEEFRTLLKRLYNYKYKEEENK